MQRDRKDKKTLKRTGRGTIEVAKLREGHFDIQPVDGSVYQLRDAHALGRVIHLIGHSKHHQSVRKSPIKQTGTQITPNQIDPSDPPMNPEAVVSLVDKISHPDRNFRCFLTVFILYPQRKL